MRAFERSWTWLIAATVTTAALAFATTALAAAALAATALAAAATALAAAALAATALAAAALALAAAALTVTAAALAAAALAAAAAALAAATPNSTLLPGRGGGETDGDEALRGRRILGNRALTALGDGKRIAEAEADGMCLWHAIALMHYGPEYTAQKAEQLKKRSLERILGADREFYESFVRDTQDADTGKCHALEYADTLEGEVAAMMPDKDDPSLGAWGTNLAFVATVNEIRTRRFRVHSAHTQFDPSKPLPTMTPTTTISIWAPSDMTPEEAEQLPTLDLFYHRDHHYDGIAQPVAADTTTATPTTAAAAAPSAAHIFRVWGSSSS